jgi:hypothetical protein
MSWIKFASEEGKGYLHLPRKERWTVLSFLWKNKTSQLVTLNISYVEDLVNEKQQLKTDLNKAIREIEHLKSLIDILYQSE